MWFIVCVFVCHNTLNSIWNMSNEENKPQNKSDNWQMEKTQRFHVQDKRTQDAQEIWSNGWSIEKW